MLRWSPAEFRAALPIEIHEACEGLRDKDTPRRQSKYPSRADNERLKKEHGYA